MTPTEAIDAMEGLGHDFFVFRDRNSNTIQVGKHLPLPVHIHLHHRS